MSTILENLQTAHRIISAVDGQYLDLDRFGQKTECGTLYCSIGWLAVSDQFKEHFELKWGHPDYPAQRFAEVVLTGTDLMINDWVVDDLFGFKSFDALFMARDQGTFDHNWHGDGSDRDLALWRLEQQLLIMRTIDTPEMTALARTCDNAENKRFLEIGVMPEAGGTTITLTVVHHPKGEEPGVKDELIELGTRALASFEGATHGRVEIDNNPAWVVLKISFEVQA